MSGAKSASNILSVASPKREDVVPTVGGTLPKQAVVERTLVHVYATSKTATVVVAALAGVHHGEQGVQ